MHRDAKPNLPPRYLVVDADPHGYMDKDVSCDFYPFEAREEADWFAEELREYRLGCAMNLGGYPGVVYVLDLTDPDHYDDPTEMYRCFAELYEEED